jgi:hypothetical protein
LTSKYSMKLLIRQRLIPTPRSPGALTVAPSRIRVTHRPLRVLDFDIENRPLSYLGSDFTTAEVTAIAWAWVDQPEDVTVFLLGEHELPYILNAFVDAYQQADVVTGHYIRGHDLPMLNGALMECRMAPLPDKMVCDTKIDMMRCKGLSLSQESLGAMFRLDYAKEQMNQIKWRAANRLTPEGLAEVRRRVVGDVRQHIGLRQELLALGYLGPSTMWRSGSARAEAYVP